MSVRLKIEDSREGLVSPILQRDVAGKVELADLRHIRSFFEQDER